MYPSVLHHPPTHHPNMRTCERAVVERVARKRLERAGIARMTAAAGFVTVAALARNPHRADVRAATTRWLSTLAASEWLRHSTEGYCATTEAAGLLLLCFQSESI